MISRGTPERMSKTGLTGLMVSTAAVALLAGATPAFAQDTAPAA